MAFSFQQLKDCKFVQGADWPRSDPAYRATPLKRHSLEDMGQAEEAVRARLAGLGVGPELIEEHIERGARSQVIGAYRILMHR